MTPFYFGASDRQLFGAYDPPASGGRRAALICQPWAREYLLAHPTLRHAARTLSRAGWHVLRFDYSGTGDSAGGDEDVSLAQWQDDTRSAIQELQDISSVQRVTLIGMRLGGTLAALSAAGRSDVERLVLWDPVQDGAALIHELRTPTVPWKQETPPPPLDPNEVAGAPLPTALRADLEAISPAAFRAKLPRTLLLNTHEHEGLYQPLEAGLAEAGVDLSREHVPDVNVWREEWGRGGVGLAVRAVERMSAWLT